MKENGLQYQMDFTLSLASFSNGHYVSFLYKSIVLTLFNEVSGCSMMSMMSGIQDVAACVSEENPFALVSARCNGHCLYHSKVDQERCYGECYL